MKRPLVDDAKEARWPSCAGLQTSGCNWQEGRNTQIKVLGEQFLQRKAAIHMMAAAVDASEYDAPVGRKLANILAGGPLTATG